MKRAKLISDTEAGKIIKLSDGRFRIDCRDSRGKRHRPAFATKDEAAAALSRIAAKKSNGEFFADGANTVFAKALDLLLARNEREGLAKASRLRVQSVINAQLRPALGARRLSEFPAERMRFVQEWFDDLARNKNLSSASLMHVRSAIKMALDEAIAAGLLGAPNPVTEFKLRVPQFVKKSEREVLTLAEISTLVRTSLCRVHREWEETFCARFMLLLLGLLAGLRDGECCGLYWDCIDFDDRTIHVRRTWRKGEGIIAETKTGKSGYRSVPMSPILFAALSTYADRLRQLGYQLDGPVLVSGRVGSVTPNAITGNHWPAIARKAGFIGEAEELAHTFYALRHTAANLWRTIGIPTDRLMTLMGHTDYHTTVSNYLHETPHFEVIRREVEALGLERTPAGLIDGLGFVLARRWRDEGIEIECAPPRSATQLIGSDAAAQQDPKMLSGTMIDLVPNSVSIEAPPAEQINPYSLEALRARQRARAKELFELGWTKIRIGDELGVDPCTVSDWVRSADNIRWMRKTSHAERTVLIARCHQLRDQNPEWSSTQLAKELGVHPSRVTLWERGRGKPMPHQPGAHKIGKHEARIRQMLAEGLGCEQMARELDGVSKSGIAYFINRIGLREQVPGARGRGKGARINVDNSMT